MSIQCMFGFMQKSAAVPTLALPWAALELHLGTFVLHLGNFVQASRATADMDLSLEARLTKQVGTNNLHVQVTGTFVSAETGVQGPSPRCKSSAGCPSSSKQAATVSPLQAALVSVLQPEPQSTALHWRCLRLAVAVSSQPLGAAQAEGCTLALSHGSLMLLSPGSWELHKLRGGRWHGCMHSKTAQYNLCLHAAPCCVQGWSLAQKPVSMSHTQLCSTLPC